VKACNNLLQNFENKIEKIVPLAIVAYLYFISNVLFISFATSYALIQSSNIARILINRARSLQRNIGPRFFFVQTEPLGRGLHKKTKVRYFSVKTKQTTLIKSLLYCIYGHLYLKQTRNQWFEMHISRVVHIWTKKTKNSNVFLPFHLKPFADILLITN
jgi:hypothetical protein